jgi:predicted signal transduction protein with EAL and GGDEF domain
MSLHSTASIGVVLFSDNILDCDALLKMADSAMYRAKAGGRNQICFFDPVLQAATTVPSAQLLLTDRSSGTCVCQVAIATPYEPVPLPITLSDKPELSP